MSRKRTAKFALVGAALTLSVAGLIAWALTRPGSTSFFMTVSEVLESGSSNEHVRVNGNVVPGSLDRDGVETSFAITDGKERLQILTKAALPDAFWSAYENSPETIEVIAQGSYERGAFIASDVFAKCPSKFKAKA